MCTTGKVEFCSPQRAYKALGKLLKRTPKDRCRHSAKWIKGELCVYRCAYCHGFHCGHRPKGMRA